MTDNKENLTKRMSAACFAAHEMNLYLDTHPFDKTATEDYRKYLKKYKELYAEYVKQYGAIIPEEAVMDGRWTWLDSPWPWEYKGVGER